MRELASSGGPRVFKQVEKGRSKLKAESTMEVLMEK